MGSKVFILLGLILAVVLLISSEVAARDLAAQTETAAKTNRVEESKWGKSGGNRGHGGGCRYGYCSRCCTYAETNRVEESKGAESGGNGHGGGCRYGHCSRCCTYAGEAKDAQTTAEPQN